MQVCAAVPLSPYLKRSSCLRRLARSLCSPSVSLYISLSWEATTDSLWKLWLWSIQWYLHQCDSHLLLLMKPCGLLLQKAQLLLGQHQLVTGMVQFPRQLVICPLQFHIFYLGDVLFTVEFLVLLLQLETHKRKTWTVITEGRSFSHLDVSKHICIHSILLNKHQFRTISALLCHSHQ